MHESDELFAQSSQLVRSRNHVRSLLDDACLTVIGRYGDGVSVSDRVARADRQSINACAGRR